MALGADEAGRPDPQALEVFEKKIRPVLVDQCFKCHSAQAKKPKAGLLLDSRAGLLKGGDNGPALVPGQPEKSRLIQAIRYQDVELRMPPKGKLPDAVVADFAKWVAGGAPWPKEDGPTTATSTRDAFDLHRRQKDHWAWRPIRQSSPPVVQNSAWPCGPVDRFLLSRLEAIGLTPAPGTDKRTLIRRLSFDLIGLPPTSAEVDAFVDDTSPLAMEKVVDRLLASPHFGERWARHWLDLVRYAETRGHEFDYIAPNAYQYRDYIIRAFNEDLPYNRLVTEHVAGDLLDQPRLHSVEKFNESILGTGFWFLGEGVHSPVDIRQDEADRFDNMIDVFSKTFLGLTVSCARCHDHKFDAISTRDYYALFGFLESSSYRLARFDSMEHNGRIARELWRLREQSRRTVQRAVAEAMRPVIDRLADYLLAAGETLAAGKEPGAAAYARKIDPAVVSRWVEELRAAGKDPGHPLHVWAKTAGNTREREKIWPPAGREALREEWRRRDRDAESALSGADVVIDYAKAGADEWLPDGVAFGAGPVRPGDIRLGSDPARPIARVFAYTAAEKDPAWDRLTLAPGAENDSGPLGKVVRSGRSLRTPTFLLKSPRLYYRLKGNARVYVSVGNHVLINGPLHGNLLQDVEAGDTWRWVSSPDLTAYAGQSTHVEFTPTDAADFAVAMVVQGTAPPREINPPNHLLLRMLGDAGSTSKEALAQAFQQLFSNVVEGLASDRIRSSSQAANYASMADWMVQRPELFLPPESKASTQLAEAVRPWLTKQAGLVSESRRDSRLAMAILDSTGKNESVFIRGSPRALGEVVPRRFLEALAGPAPLPTTRGSGRLELARQMTEPAVNPFLPRVMVNRIWHHLFGRGIVASPDNFGVMGERPTHPELLDYLASQFVHSGWSVKKLVRELVLSRAYRMSSAPQEEGDQKDPQNLLWHRARLRRLEGEAIRDAMLLLSARFNGKMFGPAVPVFLTPFLEGRGRPTSGPLDGDGQRSLYIAVRRNFLSPMLLAFDTPIPFSTVGRRTVSNVPAQALILLNDPFVQQQAELWAIKVLSRPTSQAERIVAMYQSAFARMPAEREISACREFLNRQAHLNECGADDVRGWADLAHMLFNVKEFIFLQ
jgi:hypothetical protein